jgi:DNA-binding HxlR family transcriptional regulator
MELKIGRDDDVLIMIAKNFRNRNKLKILQELGSKHASLNEIFENLKGEIKYKDNLYRNLEDMVQAGLVEKEYDKSTKRITYRLKVEKIILLLAQ